MKNNLKKNVYEVSLWEVDCDEDSYMSHAEARSSMLNRAIDVAKERARLYIMPATWEARYNDKGSITVTRWHN
jgi:hypothetical protein